MSIRWFFAIVIVCVSFVVAALLGVFVASVLQVWYEPAIGFIAAFSVVVSMFLSAPHHKLTSAVAAFFVGAVLAWLFLENSFYPESYGAGLAYTPARLPLVVTYAGGVLGLLVSALIGRWVRPNSSFKSSPLRGAA